MRRLERKGFTRPVVQSLHDEGYFLPADLAQVHTFREKLLQGTAFANAQFDTIRLNLLKIGAQARELQTKLVFRMPASFPHQELFAKIHQTLFLRS